MSSKPAAANKPFIKSLYRWLFILAVVVTPRVLDLDVFYARDELAIWPWTDQFTQAVWAGDWAGTLTTSDYPGIPLFWAQTLFLTVKYSVPSLFSQTALPLEQLFDNRSLMLLAERRFVVGLFVSVQIIAAVWLVHRLFDWRVSLLSAFFFGLDPFSLTEARVLRLEMVSALFVCLSVLAYFLYFRERQRRWVLISGVMAGLGVSTKTSAGLIVPYIWLLLVLDFFLATAWIAKPLTPQTRSQRFKQLIGNGLTWAAGAIGAFWLIWPAMWVNPLAAIEYIFAAGFGQAADRSVWGDKVFFWGEILPGDPGLYFYPVALAFRTTPLTWVGVGCALILAGLAMIRRTRSSSWPSLQPSLRGSLTSPPLGGIEGGASAPRFRASWLVIGVLLLLTYVILMILELSAVISKVDRFLLILFPELNIISAIGIAALIGWVLAWFKQRRVETVKPWQNWATVGLLALVLLLQLSQTLPAHPHYFTYWNPWAGGGRAAMGLLPMGAGEGIDLAMEFLNDQPDAIEKTVICGASQPWCERVFVGRTLRSATYDSGEWATADYVSFYISQLQRQNDPLEIVEFFMAREPLYQVDLQGATYVWVYEVPDMGHFAGPWNDLAGLGRLLSYDVGQAAQPAGETIEATVWWINTGAGADNLVLRWLDESGYEWGRARVTPLPEYAALTSEKAAVIAGTASLPIPPDTPPGLYFWRIGVTSPEDDRLLGEFELPDEADQLVVLPNEEIFSDPKALIIPQRVDQPLTPDLTLLGYTPPDQVLTPVAPTWLTLYWQAIAPPADYQVTLRLLDDAGQEVTRWQGLPAHGQYAFADWRSGEIVRDVWALQVPPGTPLGRYEVEISLTNPETAETSAAVTVSNLEVWPQPLSYEAPTMQAEVQADFGDQLTLLGYDLYFDVNGSGGGSLSPVFYWQSQTDFQGEFDLLLTLMATNSGQVVTQWQVPLGGSEAKITWRKGEVINTAYELQADALVGGRYDLEIGLQNRTTNQIEPVTLSDGNRTTAVRIENVQDKSQVRMNN